MRIGSIVLAHLEPDIPGLSYSPFSFGARRLKASLGAEPAYADVPVALLESKSLDVEEWTERIASHAPDVVGFSVYVWSFPTLIEVAKAVRKRLPACRILLGGPSARAEMLSLPPFRDAVHAVDAVVVEEGEWTLPALLTEIAHDRPLNSVAGVLLPSRDGWVPTAPRAAIEPLDALPSPIAAGLVPEGRTVPLETFRGCPMSCQFCQWGDGSPARTFSEHYLRSELEGIAELNAPSVLLVDAGINLNARAFRNLANAEASVGVFKKSRLYGAMYPSHVNTQHMEFFSQIRRPLLDLGIQTFDTDALSQMGRAFKESRLPAVVRDLGEVADIDVELILGLPGDSPESFRRTLHRALELPFRVLRIFHCLVLPDALMTKASAYDVRFDPMTLRLSSCVGWTADAIRAEGARLTELVESLGGNVGEDQWEIVGARSARSDDSHAVASEPEETPLTATIGRELAEPLAQLRLRARRVQRLSDGIRLELVRLDGADKLSVDLKYSPDGPCFREHRGVRLAYRGRDVPPTMMRALERAAPLLCAVVAHLCPRERARLPVLR